MYQAARAAHTAPLIGLYQVYGQRLSLFFGVRNNLHGRFGPLQELDQGFNIVFVAQVFKLDLHEAIVAVAVEARTLFEQLRPFCGKALTITGLDRGERLRLAVLHDLRLWNFE